MFTIIPGSATYTNGVTDSNDAILFSGAVSVVCGLPTIKAVRKRHNDD